MLGQHGGVARRLGGDQVPETERLSGHGELGLRRTGDLQVDTGGRAALVELAGRGDRQLIPP